MIIEQKIILVLDSSRYRIYNTSKLCSDENETYSEIQDNIECRKAFATVWTMFYEGPDRYSNWSNRSRWDPPKRDVKHYVDVIFNNSSFPSGCFFSVQNPQDYHVFFNEHPNGSPNAHARPICKKGIMNHL